MPGENNSDDWNFEDCIFCACQLNAPCCAARDAMLSILACNPHKLSHVINLFDRGGKDYGTRTQG